MMRRLITCPLLVVLLPVAALAQQARPDTLFLAAARQYQQSLYDASIRGQSRLYNGTEYRDYLAQGDENPYFGADDWQYGYVYYDDVRYDSVAMFYDLSRDQVITEHMLTGAKIELIVKKISAFEINHHPFERLYRDSSGVISEGFYERLYNGPTKVYVKRTKTLSSRASGNELIYTFDERNRVYLLKDNQYHPVRTKKSVLRVFGDKKPELKSMLKDEKIKFKTARERAIVRMAQTYDSTHN
ncbi:MAG TPA: hypothetical protein VK658_20865 [Chryseolinea sp.]|nr:hypothetical protein [Chryseolinea sp.]